mmetsp:Transcript_12234/g.34693  ORF Transcript_12234/g.34693 Transcript_12234/m.34693 type:complete len:319 (-) Transcript_12234:15-971(-)
MPAMKLSRGSSSKTSTCPAGARAVSSLVRAAKFGASSCSCSVKPGQFLSRSSKESKTQPQYRQYRCTVRRCVSNSRSRAIATAGSSSSGLSWKLCARAGSSPSQSCSACSAAPAASRESGGQSSLSGRPAWRSQCSAERSAEKTWALTLRCVCLAFTPLVNSWRRAASAASRCRNRRSNSSQVFVSHQRPLLPAAGGFRARAPRPFSPPLALAEAAKTFRWPASLARLSNASLSLWKASLACAWPHLSGCTRSASCLYCLFTAASSASTSSSPRHAKAEPAAKIRSTAAAEAAAAASAMAGGWGAGGGQGEEGPCPIS